MSNAAHLFELGLDWYRRGRFVEATELFDAARRTAEVLGEPLVEAEAWFQFARLSALGCEPKLAEDAFSHAARLFDAVGAPDRAIDARVRQAFVAFDAGDLDRATELLEAELSGRELSAEVRGRAVGYLGNIARSRNDLDTARRFHVDAIRTLESAGEGLYQAVFEMDLAISELLSRDFPKAWAHLQAARTGADASPGDPQLTALVAHYEAITLVGLGESALATQALKRFVALPSEGMDFLASTHGLLERIIERAPPRTTTPLLTELRINVPAFEHARLTIRLLRGLLGGQTTPDDRLTLFRAENRMRLGEEIEAHFGADSGEWRILLALAQHRLAKRTDALSLDELIAIGWPGELISAEAAKNRLHVALSKLRKRGLRDLLLRHPSGYALSPALNVLLA